MRITEIWKTKRVRTLYRNQMQIWIQFALISEYNGNPRFYPQCFRAFYVTKHATLCYGSQPLFKPYYKLNLAQKNTNTGHGSRDCLNESWFMTTGTAATCISHSISHSNMEILCTPPPPFTPRLPARRSMPNTRNQKRWRPAVLKNILSLFLLCLHEFIECKTVFPFPPRILL
jgi:hypothetical protein